MRITQETRRTMIVDIRKESEASFLLEMRIDDDVQFFKFIHRVTETGISVISSPAFDEVFFCIEPVSSLTYKEMGRFIQEKPIAFPIVLTEAVGFQNSSETNSGPKPAQD